MSEKMKITDDTRLWQPFCTLFRNYALRHEKNLICSVRSVIARISLRVPRLRRVLSFAPWLRSLPVITHWKLFRFAVSLSLGKGVFSRRILFMAWLLLQIRRRNGDNYDIICYFSTKIYMYIRCWHLLESFVDAIPTNTITVSIFRNMRNYP